MPPCSGTDRNAGCGGMRARTRLIKTMEPATPRRSEDAAAAMLGDRGLHDDGERALVADVLRRDRKATAEFVSRYADRIYSYVSRRLAPNVDLVEDVVQEVFLIGFEKLH